MERKAKEQSNEELEFDMNFQPVLTRIKQWRSARKAKKQDKNQEEVPNNEELDLDMNVQPELNRFQQWYLNKKAKRQEKEQEEVPNNEELEFDMNLQPELSRSEQKRLERKDKKKAKKEAKEQSNEELEFDMNFQSVLTRIKQWRSARKDKKKAKKEAKASIIWTAFQAIAFIAIVTIGLTIPAFPGLGLLFGIFTSVTALACVASIQNLIEKRKEYKMNSFMTQEEKAEKNQIQKKGFFKNLKNVFSRSKNKSTDDSLQQVSEVPADSLQQGNQTPTNDSDIVAETSPSTEKDSNDKKEEKISISYSLDQNGPKIMSVDLSGIHTTSGLDIVAEQFMAKNGNGFDAKHFIVDSEDADKIAYMEEQIQALTGCPAIYSDQVIDNNKKRVYMLGR